MPLARLVFLFLAGAGCFLSAQTSEQSNLTLRVQDASLAFIPNATIHVVSAVGAVNELRSDPRGQAAIRLDPGEYVLSVSAVGFQSWKSSARLTPGLDRSIAVQLRVGATCSPCLTVSEPVEIPFEHYAPIVELPSLPLESVALRAHRLRSSRFRG
jgi:hypothetical protein